MPSRTAVVERKSKETHIKASLNIDGRGDRCEIKTGIGFLDHMIELFSFHGLFDMELEVVKSDTAIDIHHTNEDIGIVLGKAFKQALGDKAGIRRFGCAGAPMESTVAKAIIDISGRGYTVLELPFSDNDMAGFPTDLIRHFLESFQECPTTSENHLADSPIFFLFVT